MKECKNYTSIFSPHAVCSVWIGSLLCPLIKKNQKQTVSSCCAAVPISPVKLSGNGRFGKVEERKLPFSFFSLQITKKKLSHDPKVNLTYREKKRERGWYKEAFPSLCIKALKKKSVRKTHI